MNDESILTRNSSGEFIYKYKHKTIKQYAPDSVLLQPITLYIVIVCLVLIDGAVLLNLFSTVSFDNKWQLIVEIAGCLWAFDVVPIYGGIQLRRLKEGLSNDWFLFWISVSVFILAVALNIALRLLVIDCIHPEMDKDPNLFSKNQITEEVHNDDPKLYFFGENKADEIKEGHDPVAIALTLFGITLPLLTALGSFVVSYLIYNPLQIRKKRLEELLDENEDAIRRIDAILAEYLELQNLLDDDTKKFQAMVKAITARALTYLEYEEQTLKEYLKSPAAITEVTNQHEAICDRLVDELAIFQQIFQKEEILYE